jgi:FlaA1/EpsC-like NDP-sugar epimerase
MRVFITGLPGTLGTAIAKIHRERGDSVFGCARNEGAIAKWYTEHNGLGTLFVGDALNLTAENSDMGRLLPYVHCVYHCAAMKHVDLCQANPEEAYRNNVSLTASIARACQQYRIRLVFISSDKACLPQSVYGATKMLGEAMVIDRGGAVVRFGNLIGSTGSVFKRWKDALDDGKHIHLTDPEMTRYFIPVAKAAKFAVDHSHAGVVTLPAMRSAIMGELAECVNVPGKAIITIGKRPGETKHQWVVAPGDSLIANVDYLAISENGEPCTNGICSATAQRWPTDELLKEAGL